MRFRRQLRNTTSVIALTTAAPYLRLTADLLEEGSAAGTVIGVVQVVGATAPYTFAITGTNGSRLALDGNQLEAGAVASDYDTADTLYATIVATPVGGGATLTQTLQVHVVASGLSDVTLSANTFWENSNPGVTIGAVVGANPLAVLSLQNDDGGRFALTGAGNLVVGLVNTNFEADGASRNVTVRQTMPSGAHHDTVLAVTCQNVNETPTACTITWRAGFTGGVVPENTAVGTILADLTFVDPDAGTTGVFSIPTGGDPDSKFTVVGTTLRLAAGLDYETKTSHGLTVRFTDQGGLYFDVATSVTAGDVVESLPIPVNTSAPYMTGNDYENQVVTANVGSWTNAPDSYLVQWKYIDAVTGAVVNLNTGLTHTIDRADVADTLFFTVVATNSGGSSAAATSSNSKLCKLAGHARLGAFSDGIMSTGGAPGPANAVYRLMDKLKGRARLAVAWDHTSSGENFEGMTARAGWVTAANFDIMVFNGSHNDFNGSHISNDGHVSTWTGVDGYIAEKRALLDKLEHDSPDTIILVPWTVPSNSNGDKETAAIREAIWTAENTWNTGRGGGNRPAGAKGRTIVVPWANTVAGQGTNPSYDPMTMLFESNPLQKTHPNELGGEFGATKMFGKLDPILQDLSVDEIMNTRTPFGTFGADLVGDTEYRFEGSAGQKVGAVIFSVAPTAGDKLTINGVEITFGTTVAISGTTGTATNLQTHLNSNLATYGLTQVTVASATVTISQGAAGSGWSTSGSTPPALRSVSGAYADGKKITNGLTGVAISCTKDTSHTGTGVVWPYEVTVATLSGTPSAAGTVVEDERTFPTGTGTSIQITSNTSTVIGQFYEVVAHRTISNGAGGPAPGLRSYDLTVGSLGRYHSASVAANMISPLTYAVDTVMRTAPVQMFAAAAANINSALNVSPSFTTQFWSGFSTTGAVLTRDRMMIRRTEITPYAAPKYQGDMPLVTLPNDIRKIQIVGTMSGTNTVVGYPGTWTGGGISYEPKWYVNGTEVASGWTFQLQSYPAGTVLEFRPRPYNALNTTRNETGLQYVF